MDCAENDFDDTCAESIDSCAVSFGFGEVSKDEFRGKTDQCSFVRM